MVHIGGSLSESTPYVEHSIIDGTSIFWRFKPREKEVVLMAEVDGEWTPIGVFPIGPVPLDTIRSVIQQARIASKV